MSALNTTTAESISTHEPPPSVSAPNLPDASDPLDDLRKQVESAHAIAREARELAERADARRTSPPRSRPALGGRFDPDPHHDLRSAAQLAARTGDRKALLDYLELKRATA